MRILPDVLKTTILLGRNHQQHFEVICPRRICVAGFRRGILFAKEGVPMRTKQLSCVLALTALALLGVKAPHAQAGSFFGPCCYGSNYTARYPARSHNVFGNLDGSPCRRWHPLWHHWYTKYSLQLEKCNGCAASNPVTVALPRSPISAGSTQIVPPSH
jgi:hypothetical protein